MRRGTREACFSRLSHTHLFLFPTTYRLFYLCLSCVLGYGWKRLDFDIDGQQVAPKVPKYMYFHRIFGDLLECLQMEHDRLETLKEIFQELLETQNAGHTPFNHTPANTYSGNSTPLSNNVNALLLPKITAQSSPRAAEDDTPLHQSSPKADEDDDNSTESSRDSDSDELQTLTDDSDVEEISNIQKISLLFQGLEDPDYDYNCAKPAEDLMDH